MKNTMPVVDWLSYGAMMVKEYGDEPTHVYDQMVRCGIPTVRIHCDLCESLMVIVDHDTKPTRCSHCGHDNPSHWNKVEWNVEYIQLPITHRDFEFKMKEFTVQVTQVWKDVDENIIKAAKLLLTPWSKDTVTKETNDDAQAHPAVDPG